MSDTMPPVSDGVGQARRRRQRRPNVNQRTLKRVRLAVYTRDGFRCLHCGWQPRSIPEGYDGTGALGDSITKPNGRSGCRLLELDHVKPYSAGGRFTVDNLQTLCNSCNARKGARV